MAQAPRSNLVLALQHKGEYPAPIEQELEQLIATLHAHFNAAGDFRVPGKLTVDAFATIHQQKAFRSFLSDTSVPDLTEHPLVWRTPVNGALDPSEYSVGFDAEFDGTRVFLKEAGLYVAHARIRWDTDVAGTFRSLQFRVGSDDTSYDVESGAPVASMIQRVFCIVRVTTDILVGGGFLGNSGVPIAVEAVQDSGGTRTLSTASTYTVVKVA